jgi:hypothetical protein
MRAMLLAAGLGLAIAGADAEEVGPYPAWEGQWSRVGSGQYDPNAASGIGQKPPLIPEYQAIFEAATADRKDGGLAYNATAGCLPAGMPRAMIVYESMEIIVTPAVTYIKLLYMNELRRIHTDGRGWPATLTPSFIGTSIGEWEKGPDGRYQALLIETRGFKGPRTFDAEGIALHADNQTVVKERIFLDAANPDRLHDEVTVFDHALTRPWTVMRTYKRETQPSYADFYCSQNNHEVTLGRETYFIGEDGLLMPTRKNQPPPDLSAFVGRAP